MFLILLILITLGFSQEIFEVTEVKTLIVPPEYGTVFMYPKWSPDGEKIAFTSANFRGIWIYNLQNEKMEQITDEMAAGFGFSWASNSKAILSRVSKFENNRRLTAVKIFNLGDKEDIYLTDYRLRLPDVPKWNAGNDQVFFYNGRQMEYLDTSLERDTSSSQITCYSVSDRIFLENRTTGDKKTFQPFPESMYLNLVLSPDKEHVAFEVYGGNCYVMNVENSHLTDLGPGNYPTWSPDGKYLAFMLAKDDGYRYTASDIVVTDTEGTFFQNLTAELDQIAMYPSWSPADNRIVYSTYDFGTIEMIEFNE